MERRESMKALAMPDWKRWDVVGSVRSTRFAMGSGGFVSLAIIEEFFAV